MVKDGVGLPLPRFGVVRVRKVIEHVSDEDACSLSSLGLLAPVEHEPVGDVLHEIARDPLDVGALFVGQHGVGPREQVEDRELRLG